MLKATHSQMTDASNTTISFTITTYIALLSKCQYLWRGKGITQVPEASLYVPNKLGR